MFRLRAKSWVRLGTWIATLALGLQLTLSSAGLLLAASIANPVDALAEHALCLAAADNGAGSTSPADPSPDIPQHHHWAFCCLWHHPPGLAAASFQVPQRVAYVAVAPRAENAARFSPGPRHDPPNARAPPFPA